MNFSRPPHLLDAIRGLADNRFLITGGHGMLGQAFARQLQIHAPHCEVRALGKKDLDVAQGDQVAAQREWIRGGWILNCAALVDVEGCAKNPAFAEATILQGTRNVVELAKAANAKILYPQTFLIYDGQTNPIAEDCPASPLSLYGRLKAAAEAAIVDSGVESLIVRMAGFFGGEARDKNFVGKLIPNLANMISKGQSSFAVGDRVWQPTWTDDLALNSLGLIAHGKRGTYQMACHGEASFFELTQAVVEELGWDDVIEITKVSSEQVSRHELGGRPPKAVLSCRRIHEEGLDMQRPWRETLREYLASPYFDQFRSVRPEHARPAKAVI